MNKSKSAIFIVLLAWIPFLLSGQWNMDLIYDHGAIVKGDSNKKQIAIIFSGDEYGEGLKFIRKTLKRSQVPASFFLTGRFYRNNIFKRDIRHLIQDGQYFGAHSDQHLLYCDWDRRDSLLVTKKEFEYDLQSNYQAMGEIGVNTTNAIYFLPPYEWFNDSIISWTQGLGYRLINFSPGTLSHADYMVDQDKNYRSNQVIWRSIVEYEAQSSTGLNGFLLLMHVGAGPKRREKFYRLIPQLIRYLLDKGYKFTTVPQMLN